MKTKFLKGTNSMKLQSFRCRVYNKNRQKYINFQNGHYYLMLDDMCCDLGLIKPSENYCGNTNHCENSIIDEDLEIEFAIQVAGKGYSFIYENDIIRLGDENYVASISIAEGAVFTQISKDNNPVLFPNKLYLKDIANRFSEIEAIGNIHTVYKMGA